MVLEKNDADKHCVGCLNMDIIYINMFMNNFTIISIMFYHTNVQITLILHGGVHSY